MKASVISKSNLPHRVMVGLTKIQKMNASHVIQQAAMKYQIFCFDWKIAVGIQ